MAKKGKGVSAEALLGPDYKSWRVQQYRDIVISHGMGTWTPRGLRRTKQSQTPGKTKNPDTCQASKMDRYFASIGRSYKHRDYSDWCKKYTRINHGR